MCVRPSYRHAKEDLHGQLCDAGLLHTAVGQCDSTSECEKKRMAKQDMWRQLTFFSRPSMQLLVLNPSDRMPLKDVLTHPWITQYASRGRTSGSLAA